MLSHRPDLIVPIRDRRQGKRYLTLKNFGIVLLVLLVLFVIVSVRSEMRDPDQGKYGRLVNRELPSPVRPQPLEVVSEQKPVDDNTHADPMLTTPAAREQYLHAATNMPDATAAPVTVAAATIEPLPRAEASVATGQTRVAIVGGGTDGVKIVQQTRRRPVLSGGFGKHSF
jgi:hypothetical protein